MRVKAKKDDLVAGYKPITSFLTIDTTKSKNLNNNLVLGSDNIARWRYSSDLEAGMTQVYKINKPTTVTFYADPDCQLVEIKAIDNADGYKSLVPVLKSNLQKAVRLGQVETAVVSAVALLRIAPTELLRRLPIIILEDKYGSYSELHDYLATLLFTTVTRRGPPEYGQFIVDLTARVASGSYAKYGSESTRPTWNNQPHVNNLQLRNFYGGMKGDMAMLNWMIRDQAKREYIPSSPLRHYRDYDDIVTSIGELTVLPSAVDFHVCPGMSAKIAAKHADITADDVKSAVWHHSSSLRCDHRPERPSVEVWNRIERDVNGFQTWYISQVALPKLRGL